MKGVKLRVFATVNVGHLKINTVVTLCLAHQFHDWFNNYQMAKKSVQLSFNDTGGGDVQKLSDGTAACSGPLVLMIM